jgi:hypothetical protein
MKKKTVSKVMMHNKVMSDARAAEVYIGAGCMSPDELKSIGVTDIEQAIEMVHSVTPLCVVVATAYCKNAKGEDVELTATSFYRKNYALCSMCGKYLLRTDDEADCDGCRSYGFTSSATTKQAALLSVRRQIQADEFEVQHYDFDEIEWLEIPK